MCWLCFSSFAVFFFFVENSSAISKRRVRSVFSRHARSSCCVKLQNIGIVFSCVPWRSPHFFICLAWSCLLFLILSSFLPPIVSFLLFPLFISVCFLFFFFLLFVSFYFLFVGYFVASFFTISKLVFRRKLLVSVSVPSASLVLFISLIFRICSVLSFLISLLQCLLKFPLHERRAQSHHAFCRHDFGPLFGIHFHVGTANIISAFISSLNTYISSLSNSRTNSIIWFNLSVCLHVSMYVSVSVFCLYALAVTDN